MTGHLFQSRFGFRNDVMTPLGQLTNANIISNGRGVPAHMPRVYDRFAIVYLLEGAGRYWDANQYTQVLKPGDLIVVFPELAHTYGPGPQQTWTELHVIFEGPAFDWLRHAGILDPARPVHRLEAMDYWLSRLMPFLEGPAPMTERAKCQEAGRLLGLLTEMCALTGPAAIDASQPLWLLAACGLLESDLSQDLDFPRLAAQLDISYQTFRKRFRDSVGLAPAQYRLARRIEAACELLQFTRMTHRQVAENLGFSDEFHFSKRFRQMKGMTPREFRRRSSS